MTLFGFSAGYGILNMEEVNRDLNNTYNLIRSTPNSVVAPDEIGGGAFVEGNVLINIRELSIGAAVDHISGKGNFSFSNSGGSLEENYSVSTTEILGIIGTNWPLDEKFSFSIRGYFGYGLASALYSGGVSNFTFPENNLNVSQDVSGGYFAARFQFGFDILIESVILNLSTAYRFANSGQLKGTLKINGVNYTEMGIKNISGNDIEFDFSGFLFTAGIQFSL